MGAIKHSIFVLTTLSSLAITGVISACSVPLPKSTPDSPPSIPAPDNTTSSSSPPPLPNANHIFNAIRAATRQWDSSWFHNGMSFFPAVVPAGIQLYHGTSREEPVVGMEWLAFEPEHALMFARGRIERRPRKPPGGGAERGGGFGRADTGEGWELDCDRVWDGEGKGGDGWSRRCEIRNLPGDGRQPFKGEDISHETNDHKFPHPPPPRQHGPRPDEPPHPPHPPFDDEMRPPPSPPHHEHGRPPPDFEHDRPPPLGCYNNDKNKPHQPPPFPHPNQQHALLSSPNPNAPPPPPPPKYNFTPAGPGYLQHYRTARALNLILIDGMSAGKTTKGTLDSQDFILARNNNNNNETHDTDLHGPNNPFLEMDRAYALCNTSRDEWGGAIDGFMRMECGFELILCHFERDLQFERAQLVPPGDTSGEMWMRGIGGFWMYRAIADRFWGIGGGRVVVDFENMVTVFDRHVSGLFVEDGKIEGAVMPRLVNVSREVLKGVREDVTDVVVRPRTATGVDWQEVADMFVTRYADVLRYLVSYGPPRERVQYELGVLLRPFVSDGMNDTEVAIRRCVDQFLPPVWNRSLAGRAVQHVGYTLCHTLVSALQNVSTVPSSPAPSGFEVTTPTSDVIAELEKLMAYLDWPIWHFCQPSCSPAEICVLPIWPITASVQDRIKPSCKNVTRFDEERRDGGRGEKNYWYGGEDDGRLNYDECPADGHGDWENR